MCGRIKPLVYASLLLSIPKKTNMNYKDLIWNPKTKTYDNAEGQVCYGPFWDGLKFHAEGLAAVQDETGWYHLNLEGLPAYAARYLRCFGYYEGRAAVVASEGWFHVDVQGQPLYAERYAWCGNFQAGRCVVRNHQGQYFHLNEEGQPLYAARYAYVGDYKDGYAVVHWALGQCKHLDKQGNFIYEPVFRDLGVFHKQFATARDEQGWFHINILGQALYAQRYQAVEPFYNGQALVEDFDGRKWVIDEQGRVVLGI
jgi:hypothetical protein